MMKNSIGYQLFKRGLIVLLFILLMAIAGQTCIWLLNNTSKKVFVEYMELDALQEFKTELNHMVINLKNFALNDNLNTRTEFGEGIQNCHLLLKKCNTVLTYSHDRTQLINLKNRLEQVDSLKSVLFSIQQTHDERMIIYSELISIINKGTHATENLLAETKIEIEEFIQINNTAVRHSTISIISLGIVLLIIATIGGFLFINKLTGPISTLLNSTKKVSEGKFSTIVKIDANNEFRELADSFNFMTKTLEKTTVSKDYYDNILKNMIEPLIVTNASGQIKRINKIALNLLNYNMEELKNSKVEKLFYNEHGSTDTDFISKEMGQKAISNSERIFLTKGGRKIPILMSSSVVNDNDGEVFRHIIVAHDLTEKKKNERKLEMERKENLIAINDAHEEEKFRIAIDLHDGLGQILTAISYSFQNLFGEINKDNSECQEKVNVIQEQIDSAISESKNIAHNLIPIALKDFGLVVAINNLIDIANQRTEIKFSFNTFNYSTRINEKLEKAIFRIFQEATNNIIKHSKAKNAHYQINKYEDAIVIVIEDDGIGFDLNEKTISNKLNGIGLIGMRERVLAFSGNFTLNTEPNAGTEILIEIPCIFKHEKN